MHPRGLARGVRAALRELVINSLSQVKGFLLEVLRQTQASLLDKQDDLRRAIELLLTPVRMRNELTNVFQFASVEPGVRGDERGAREFVDRMIGSTAVAASEDRLRTEPTPGFAIVANNGLAFDLQRGTHVAWNNEAWWDRNPRQFAFGTQPSNGSNA